MTRHLTYISCILLLILTACGRGCTSNHTYDSEEKTITVDGEKVIISAKINDARRSKTFARNITNHNVSHSYSMQVSVKYKNTNCLAFFSYSVQDPDVVDLDKELNLIKVDFSKDKNHLAIGYDDELFRTYHFYKGQEAHDMYPDDHETKAWDKRNLEDFKKPEEVMKANLLDCNDFTFFGDSQLYENYIASIALEDSLHYKFLKNWPECSKYGENEFLKKGVKNKVYKKWFVERVKIALTEVKGFERNSIYEAIDFIGNKELLNYTDSILIANNSELDYNEEERLITRMNSKGIDKLSDQNISILSSSLHSDLDNYIKENGDVFRYSVVEMAERAAILNDTMFLTKYINAVVNNPDDFISYRFYDVINSDERVNGVPKKSNMLTPSQEKVVQDNAEVFLSKVSKYERKELLKNLKFYISPTNFDELKKKYVDSI